ncbi:MAG: hypothetical protein V7603_1505 [Micromonosporaceae bacterium]
MPGARDDRLQPGDTRADDDGADGSGADGEGADGEGADGSGDRVRTGSVTLCADGPGSADANITVDVARTAKSRRYPRHLLP